MVTLKPKVTEKLRSWLLLACCWPLATSLLETAPSLLVRCYILAGTLLENGVFQQGSSNKPARDQQGISNLEAIRKLAGSNPAARNQQELLYNRFVRRLKGA
jgi:hypothetical protein